MHSAGHFHTRKGQRYHREGRGRYYADRLEIRPATTYRLEYVEEVPRTTRARPIIVQHDDYPGARRRITDYTENHEDAEFRRRDSDMLREESGRGRREEVHFRPRRYDS